MLYLYDIPTGKHLGSVPIEYDCTPWFAQNEYEVWFWKDDGINRWKIVEGSEPSITELENLGLTIDEPVSPWHSSHGYKILDGQWIFNCSGKRLLWLPPPWRSYQSGWTLGELWQWRNYDWRQRHRTWSGQFLTLLYHELSEAIILELE